MKFKTIEVVENLEPVAEIDYIPIVGSKINFINGDSPGADGGRYRVESLQYNTIVRDGKCLETHVTVHACMVRVFK